MHACLISCSFDVSVTAFQVKHDFFMIGLYCLLFQGWTPCHYVTLFGTVLGLNILGHFDAFPHLILQMDSIWSIFIDTYSVYQYLLINPTLDVQRGQHDAGGVLIIYKVLSINNRLATPNHHLIHIVSLMFEFCVSGGITKPENK